MINSKLQILNPKQTLMLFQSTTKHENNLIFGANPPLPPFTKGGSGGILPLKTYFRSKMGKLREILHIGSNWGNL